MKKTLRPCYLCHTADNPIIASEVCEQCFGRPFMPEGMYLFARCRKCGLLYVDSNVTDEYLYDLYAQESEATIQTITPAFSCEQHMTLRLPEFLQHWHLMKHYRQPQSGDQLLDVGCQTGEFGSVVQRDQVQPHGIELSVEYAAQCRRCWGPHAEVFCGDVRQARFTVPCFHYISAFETLEHMCDPAAGLRMLSKWLAPDGILALSVPSSDFFHFKYWLLARQPLASAVRAFFKRRSAFYVQQILPHSHIFNFTHAAVQLLLRKAGFEPLYVGLTGWHGACARLGDCLGHLVEKLSWSRIGFAPSILAIARLQKSAGPESIA